MLCWQKIINKPATKRLMAKHTVTPWEVSGDVDYHKLIKDFGTTPLDDKLLKRLEKHAGGLHYFFKRGIFFSHRDFNWILDKLEKGEPFHLYTGRGPSGHVHLGHMVPWMLTKWLQDVFDCELWFQLTDDEKFLFSKKGLTLEEAKHWAHENALDIIALGFNPAKTKIFINTDYAKTLYPEALKVAKKLTVSTANATFGFERDDNVGQLFYTAMQSAPCFIPSKLAGKNIPCLVPLAIDQDPHFRITRDVAEKLGYYKPAILHGRFLPALQQGGKMSASEEHTAIFTTDDPKTVKNKINKYAFSGGRATIEEHRAKGGNPDIDVAYQYLTFFEEDDKKLKKIYNDYKSGKLLTGELKALCIDKINGFLAEHQKRRVQAKKQLDKFLLKD